MQDCKNFFLYNVEITFKFSLWIAISFGTDDFTIAESNEKPHPGATRTGLLARLQLLAAREWRPQRSAGRCWRSGTLAAIGFIPQ
jgi:hypothetical protein